MRLNGRLNRLSSVLFRYDAPIVKWYNTSMVRRRSKFDSWWEHHPKLRRSGTCKKLGCFGVFGDFGNTTLTGDW